MVEIEESTHCLILEFRVNIGIEAFVFLLIGIFLFSTFPIILIANNKLKKRPKQELKLRKSLTGSKMVCTTPMIATTILFLHELCLTNGFLFSLSLFLSSEY
jgi:hypothetical protein